MNRIRLLTTLAGMMVLTGCWSGPLMSLHPLYTENDLASDPTLKGNWKLDNHCVLTIRQTAKFNDEILCSEDGRETKLDVAVIQLAGFQFLDLMEEGTGDWGIPAHVFAKLDRVSRDEMHLSIFGSEWLDKVVAARRFPHEVVGKNNDTTVLTASTRELQQFVLSYVSQPEAFDGDGNVLVRLP